MNEDGRRIYDVETASVTIGGKTFATERERERERPAREYSVSAEMKLTAAGRGLMRKLLGDVSHTERNRAKRERRARRNR